MLEAEYWTRGAQIFTNAWGDFAGTPLRIKGASWFGLESGSCTVGGADHTSLSQLAAWVKAQGINAIRLPLAVDAVLESAGGATAKCQNDGVYYNHNRHFMGLPYVEQVERFVRILGEHGLLVMLDM